MMLIYLHAGHLVWCCGNYWCTKFHIRTSILRQSSGVLEATVCSCQYQTAALKAWSCSSLNAGSDLCTYCLSLVLQENVCVMCEVCWHMVSWIWFSQSQNEWNYHMGDVGSCLTAWLENLSLKQSTDIRDADTVVSGQRF